MDYRLFETLLSSLFHLCAWLCPNVSGGYIYALEDGINGWRNRICFEAYQSEASLSWSFLAFLILQYRLPFRKASLQECHIPPLLNMEWKRRCCLKDEIACCQIHELAYPQSYSSSHFIIMLPFPNLEFHHALRV